MDKSTTNWLRNLLIIPLVVGLVVVAFAFSLPKLFEKDSELSYSLEEPNVQLDKNTMGDVKVEINDIDTSLLVAQSTRIWNSGEFPIKTLPIRYIFETSSSTFRIFMVTHNTKPKYEFGNITSTKADQYSRRFVYDLLNPGDEVTITFLTNEAAPVSVYAKAEGLSVKLVEPLETNRSEVIVEFMVIAIAISVLTMLFEGLSKLRRRSR
jgi:hypothetical protein